MHSIFFIKSKLNKKKVKHGKKKLAIRGSPSGAKAGATFYSLIETCKSK
jgi:hypothetical protein